MVQITKDFKNNNKIDRKRFLPIPRSEAQLLIEIKNESLDCLDFEEIIYIEKTKTLHLEILLKYDNRSVPTPLNIPFGDILEAMRHHYNELQIEYSDDISCGNVDYYCYPKQYTGSSYQEFYDEMIENKDIQIGVRYYLKNKLNK